MLTKKISDYIYLNQQTHFNKLSVLFTILLLTFFLIFISFNELHSEIDLNSQPKIKMFNKVGQRESIRVGENVSIILGPNIKPEYSYFAYFPGKSINEYYVELKSNEPLLKEISNLRNSIDSIKINQKTAFKADESFNQTDHGNNKSSAQNLISNNNSAKSKALSVENSKDNDFSIFSTGKFKKYIDNLKNIIDSNNNTISRNKVHIDTLRKELDRKNSNNDLSGKYEKQKEIEYYEKMNSDLAKQNEKLENDLKLRQMDYENLFNKFIFLVVGTALIIVLALVLYWNYRQKKKFGNQMEIKNTELQNINLQLREKNVQIQDKNEQLIKSKNKNDKYLKIIKTELHNAAEYVTSLIPKPIVNSNEDKIRTDWLFIPSADLGGDTFGYNWINKENFAFYLLDVSGHGIGPALHSVQVLNLLHNKTLPKVDFTKPDEVLTALNKIFQMGDHNDLFFTMWYGVYNKTTKILRYASAGHPPAILFNSDNNFNLLSSQNIFIGAAKQVNFKYNEVQIEIPSELYLYSDGVYELMNSDRKLYSMAQLPNEINDVIVKGKNNLLALYENAKKYSGKDILDDDYSILKINFDK